MDIQKNRRYIRTIPAMFGSPRPDWLALHEEEPIDPSLPIVDAHHHLWEYAGNRYLLDDFAEDLAGGHNVVASVYVECGSRYRKGGPEELRPIGEVEFAAKAAEAGKAYGKTDICSAIVGTVDLSLGSKVEEVLAAAIEAGRGRLRGIRRMTGWDADEELMAKLVKRRPGMLAEPSFREGFACLASFRLSFDAFVFQRQLPEVLDLARSFPETMIVVDHCGGPIGVASYGRDLSESFREWRTNIEALARLDNVYMKLGGLGMRLAGFDFESCATPPSSTELAAAWHPYIDALIQAFGPSRCMFESNFPADKGTCSYTVLWNAFKLLAEPYSSSEKADLFCGSASRFYRLT